MTRTLGQWMAKGSEIVAPSPRYPSSNLLVAQVYETAMLKDEPDHLPSDSALIAAAPALLDALKISQARIHSDICSSDWCCDECLAALAALAKATLAA